MPAWPGTSDGGLCAPWTAEAAAEPSEARRLAIIGGSRRPQLEAELRAAPVSTCPPSLRAGAAASFQSRGLLLPVIDARARDERRR
jgi:hypothetical protein